MKSTMHFYEAFACKDNGEEFSLGLFPKLLLAKRAIISDECHSTPHDLKKTTYTIERVDVFGTDIERVGDENAAEAIVWLLSCGYGQILVEELLNDDDFNELRCERNNIVFSRRARYEL